MDFVSDNNYFITSAIVSFNVVFFIINQIVCTVNRPGAVCQPNEQQKNQKMSVSVNTQYNCIGPSAESDSAVLLGT